MRYRDNLQFALQVLRDADVWELYKGEDDIYMGSEFYLDNKEDAERFLLSLDPDSLFNVHEETMYKYDCGYEEVADEEELLLTSQR